MTGALIQVTGLSKDYILGDNVVRALRDVDLTIAAGEFVAIMGPSGSGKTTMMNLLGCLDTPTRGTYLLNGVDMSELQPDELAETRNARIGFVFQSFNLLARTSAADNVQLPLMYARLKKAQRREAAERVLNDVGLGDRMDHQPSQLSGGQQQRVAIARALVNDPQLIFADEPTGALDTRTGIEIMAIFQRLNREAGMTVVLVTHEAGVARFADRVVRFRDGVVISDTRTETREDADALLKSMDVPEAAE